MSPAVDSHVHLWNRSADPQPWIDPATMAAIDRDFEPADLDRMLTATGTDLAVVVQSSNSAAETARLLAHPGPRIAGVVGWVDLTDDPRPQLDQLLAGTGRPLVGLRHLVHLDPNPQWLGQPAVIAGLGRLDAYDLGFDLVIRSSQLPLAALAAQALPEVRFVVDHLGGIVEADDFDGWATGLRAYARRPNTWAKISGLAGLMADGADVVRRAIDVALEVFGPDRLMYGSDWPVAELGAGASAWRAAAGYLLGELRPAERHAIFSGSAADFYRIAA